MFTDLVRIDSCGLHTHLDRKDRNHAQKTERSMPDKDLRRFSIVQERVGKRGGIAMDHGFAASASRCNSLTAADGPLFAPKIAVPATNTFAPAAAAVAIVFASMPPSTSSSQSRF